MLALDGNAAVSEWACSPLPYEEVAGFRGRFVDLLNQITDPAKVFRHYLGLLRGQVARIGGLSGAMRLKKLFYVIRPVIALDWMAQRDCLELPPMNLIECLKATAVPENVIHDIMTLIALKAETRELGEGPAPEALRSHLENRLAFHEANVPSKRMNARQTGEHFAMAEDFYRREVEAFSGL